MSDFNFVRSYDIPDLLLSQALDGELSFRGGYATIFAPDRLSLQERNGVTERLQAAAGNSTIGNALVGVLTNPLTYLLFLTSPIGGHSVARAGAGLVNVGKNALAYTKKVPLIQHLGALPTYTNLRGSVSGAVVQEVVHSIDKVTRETMETLDPFVVRAVDRIKQQYGIKRLTSLDPEDTQDPAAKQLLGEIQDLLILRKEGFNRSVRRFPESEVGKPLINLDIDGNLRRLGGDELVTLADQYENATKLRAIRLFGKDTPDNLKSLKFEADGTKLLRLISGLNNDLSKKMSISTPDGSQITLGREFIESLFDPETGRRLAKTIFSESQDPEAFKKLATELEGRLNIMVNEGAYMPRNQPAIWDGAAGKYSDDIWDQAGKLTRSMDSTASARGRVNPLTQYRPEDIDRMEALVTRLGGTVNKEWADLSKTVKDAQAAAIESGESVRFMEANYFPSMNRYLKDSAASYAFNVAPLGEDVLAAQRSAYGQRGNFPDMKEQFINPLAPRDPVIGKFGKFGKPFSEMAPNETPPWGWTAADALLSDYKVIDNKYIKELIPRYVLPAIAGRHSANHTVLDVVTNELKSITNTAMRGPMGQLLRDAGAGDFVDASLAHTAVDDILTKTGTQNFLVRTGYASHLGLNPGSIILNSTQPLLSAHLLGAGNVAKGYGRAFKEMWEYTKERAAIGARRMTPAESDALIRKHFKYAEEMGVTGDIYQNLDAVTESTINRYRKATGLDNAYQLMLAPFQKVEMFNRATIAHATANAVTRGGREVVDEGTLRRTVAEFTGETQFGGGILNTPVMFASQDPRINKLGFLANPLMRMFFTFPARQAITTAYAAPRLGAAKRVLGVTGIEVEGPGAALLNDVARGLGVSAVVYELGKGLIQADLSRGLFLESNAALIGGNRFLTDESSLPFVPPVIDIPVQTIKGLLGGDMELFGRNVMRGVPGGVALSRALGMAPDLGPLQSIGVQRTWVDYSNVQPDGTVPVMDRNNRVIDYQDPLSIIMKGLGADLSKYNDAAERDRFVLGNQEEIRNYQRRAAAALTNGDVRRAERIAGEFQRRFGFQLPLTQDRIEAQRENNTQSRTARIVGRLPAEARAQYEEAFAGQARNLGPQVEPTLRALPTAAQEYLRRSENAEAARESAGFAPFTGF